MAAAIAVVIIAAAPVRSATDDLCTTATPFVLTPRGGIAVEAILDGRGPFRLLIDTGSTHSVITDDVAADLRAAPVARSALRSVTGERMVPVVAIDHLDLGPHTTAIMPSVVPGMPDDDEGVDGLIGQDVLLGLHFTIDVAGRRILWHRTGCRHVVADRAVVLPLEQADGRFLVRAIYHGRAVRLVPDSASESLVVFASPGHTSDASGDDRVVGRLDTLTGSGTARRATPSDLRLGSAAIVALPAVILERTRPGPGDADGLLPLHVFDRVTFHGPARWLGLEGGVLSRPPSS